MMQKPWFKCFIWFITIFFFFLASGVVISILRPGPSQTEVMRFMEGMMGAMDNSMMGVAMNIEHDVALKSIIEMSGAIALPIIIICVAAGIGIRLIQQRDNDVG